MARGAIGLAFASAAFGQPIIAHHTRSHKGCPFNDTADWIAKSCARGCSLPQTNQGSPELTQAAQEGLLQNLWMTACEASSCVQLPFLNSSGAWAAAAISPGPLTRPGVPQALQPPPCMGSADCLVSLRLFQYNCLSLKGWGATSLIAKSLDFARVSVAGLQETRLKAEGISQVDGFWVVSSCCTARGVGGCQLWLKAGPSPDGHAWDRSSFSTFHAEPQILIVLATFAGAQFALFVAHAPPSDSPSAVLQEFWGRLEKLACQVPQRSIPFFFVDANARFGAFAGAPQTLDSAPECPNARHLVDLCHDLAVSPTAQFDCEGQRLVSWVSPTGRPALLDYVLVPEVCSPSLRTLPTPATCDFHAGVDHFPVLASCELRIAANSSKVGKRLNLAAIPTAQSCKVIRDAFCSLPPIPWTIDPTSHVELIHGHLSAYLQEHLPPPPRRTRHPAITEATLGLVYARRHARSVARTAGRRERKAMLQAFFCAWRHGEPTMPVVMSFRYARRQRVIAMR